MLRRIPKVNVWAKLANLGELWWQIFKSTGLSKLKEISKYLIEKSIFSHKTSFQ